MRALDGVHCKLEKPDQVVKVVLDARVLYHKDGSWVLPMQLYPQSESEFF